MTPPRGRLAGWVAVVVPALVLLAGCGAASAPLDAGVIRFELRQARADWAARVVQVRVDNETAHELSVVRASLETAGFVGTAVARAPVAVPPGAAREVSFPLGPAECDVAAGADSATQTASAADEAHVRMELEDAGGSSSVIEASLADPNGHLERIRGEDCAAAAVAAGALVSFGPGLGTRLDQAGLTGLLELRVTAVPGGPRVEIGYVEDTVLLQAPREGAVGWEVDLDTAVAARQSTVLDVVPARCDPHAVAEDKRGTFFAVHATVDGVDQPVFYVPVDEEQRGSLRALVAEHCGWGAGSG